MALESLPKIAPALFSAEQDLIQIYNKKSDTFGTINASLLGGSTPPSGVSGAIQFSNGSAFASDAANLFWNNTTKRLGIGTNTPIAPLNIQSDTQNVGILSVTTSGGGLDRFEVWNTNSVSTPVWNIGLPSPDTRITMFSNISLRANGTTAAVFESNEASFGSISGARVGIKGTGSTSATTSLLVQNSAGTDLLKVTDNGKTNISGSSEATPSFTTGGILNIIGSATNALIMGSLSTSPFGLYIQGGGSGLYPLLLNPNGSNVGIATTNPTAKLHIQGSGATSATNSFLVQNSAGNTALQVLDDSRVVLGNASDFAVYSGSGITSRFAMSVGTTSLPTATLQVKGSGSTSATTSLLVQNSAGSTAMQVFDHLDTRLFGALAFNNGNTYILNQSNTLEIAAINGSTSDVQIISGRQVNINNTGSYTAQASAILQADSTTKGFLPPRMTDAQIRAIASPAEGLVAYNTTINHLCAYQGGVWVKFNHSPM